MNVCAVVPTFNRKDCIDSLCGQLLAQKPESIDLSIVVVVDGSSDGTLKMLKSKYRDVHVVEGDGNWWYTKSMNQGFKFAQKLNPELVLTLNDDIILSDNYVSNILDRYKNIDDQCILGSVSFTQNKPHRILNCGVKKWNRYLDWYSRYFSFYGLVEPSSITGVHPTIVLPGRGMLIPWLILKKLNFFDQKFAQYHSDWDFTLRAKNKLKIPIYICFDAKIYSYVEKTNSSSSFLKSPFSVFLKNFINPYSRIYFRDKSRYYWRHGLKPLWPWYMIKFFLVSFKNHFLKFKIA